MNIHSVIRSLIISTLLGFLTTISSAKIGESVSECDQRYGDTIDHLKEGRKRVYQVGGFYVSCWFYEGKCESIDYSFLTPSNIAPRKKDPLNKDQVIKILEINGAEWKQIDKSTYGQDFEGLWETNDKKLSAKVYADSILIETKSRAIRSSEMETKAKIDQDISILEKGVKK